MPSEAQIKAQIAAALAKKKQQAQAPTKEVTPPPAPKVEIKLTPPPPPPVEMANAVTPAIVSEPTPVATATSLVFGGQAIRFTTFQNRVYFAVPDLLQLSHNHEWNNKLIDFLNNPKTKKEAEELTKVLTFKNEDDSDKTHGATALNAIKIFHALGLVAPGPLSRWLAEISETHKSRA